MTREKLQELNDLWEKLDDTVAVIDLLKNMEDGEYISTFSGDRAYISSELVEKLLPILVEYEYQLRREFEEM